MCTACALFGWPVHIKLAKRINLENRQKIDLPEEKCAFEVIASIRLHTYKKKRDKAHIKCYLPSFNIQCTRARINTSFHASAHINNVNSFARRNAFYERQLKIFRNFLKFPFLILLWRKHGKLHVSVRNNESCLRKFPYAQCTTHEQLY